MVLNLHRAYALSILTFPIEYSERNRMNSGLSHSSHRPFARIFNMACLCAVSLGAPWMAGCGGTAGSIGKTMDGYTAVTVLATSTANDQLSAFNIEFTNITLTSQSGQTVSLVSAPIFPEFIHLNGTAEPLATVSIPQGVYTSATATIGSSQFTCVGLNSSGSLQSSVFAYAQTPSNSVTLNMPAPINVTGTSMGLSLNLLVSQSETLGSCQGGGNDSFSITPTFRVTPVTIAAQPTNASNGKATGLLGQISSVNGGGSSFTVEGADGPNLNGPRWQVNSSGSTVFQGVNGIAQLASGMPVDMDVAIQADGTLLATRVAVQDTNTSSLNIFSGPVNYLMASAPVAYILFQEQQGHLDQSSYYEGAFPVSVGSATFQTSSNLTNLSDLPFSPRFTAANMVTGQNVSVTSHAATFPGSPLPGTTVTLMPQTIDGTVSAISYEGGFTAYTVILAAYDGFPNLAVQPGQTTALTDPGTVIVYADSNTQSLNTPDAGVGSLLRFKGLVFNDNGTLRMDCAQINDGVAE